jgi:hypothetical protein
MGLGVAQSKNTLRLRLCRDSVRLLDNLWIQKYLCKGSFIHKPLFKDEIYQCCLTPKFELHDPTAVPYVFNFIRKPTC